MLLASVAFGIAALLIGGSGGCPPGRRGGASPSIWAAPRRGRIMATDVAIIMTANRTISTVPGIRLPISPSTRAPVIPANPKPIPELPPAVRQHRCGTGLRSGGRGRSGLQDPYRDHRPSADQPVQGSEEPSSGGPRVPVWRRGHRTLTMARASAPTAPATGQAPRIDALADCVVDRRNQGEWGSQSGDRVAEAARNRQAPST